MRFDTVTFWLFFPVVWVLWRLLPFGAAKSLTLLASLGFYAWWKPQYVLLIFGSALVDYHVGARIFAASNRKMAKRWLVLSLCVNLGLLGVFKYAPFLLDNLGAWTGLFDAGRIRVLDGWVVPVGISFYTFQTLSYSLDIYRGQLKPCASFRDFFLYVSFFPQLVAGPIVRASEFLPQLAKRTRLHGPMVQIGIYRVLQGLFLKMVVADGIGRAVNRLYAPKAVAGLSAAEAWLGAIYFGAQIFADFAAYSGIAIGVAYLMGLRFPENFRYPYISQGLSEFWTRWHITLSQWLRDYLYIPLGGNRQGPSRTKVNLLLTMLLGGLWHGAAWTYVAWGAMHGAGLIVERMLTGRRRSGADQASGGFGGLALRCLRIGVTFAFVHTAWVFFRAPTFDVAWTMLGHMYVDPVRGSLGLDQLREWHSLVFVLPIAALHGGQLLHEWLGLRKSPRRRAALAGVYLLGITLFSRGEGVEFIYFQF